MTPVKPAAVALIPARSGSKRVPDKNIRPLAGHPLLAYSISAALQSGVFSEVIVSTDSKEYAEMARHYGAEVPFLRPASLSGDRSPDIEWVEYTLKALAAAGHAFDCFSILRPTSPFRQPQTIRRAWQAFLADPVADSLRAVERCKQHPGKMWLVNGNRMQPLLPQPEGEIPWHSRQYQDLPEIYVQNASLEIAWNRVVFQQRSISGKAVIPFFTEGYEGFDVNRIEDWRLAESAIRLEEAQLPKVSQPSICVSVT